MAETLKYQSDPTGQCIRLNPHGVAYEEFSCLFPTLGKTYFDFEINYDPKPGYDWMKNNHWWAVPLAVIGYFSMLHFGQQYFRKREPWNLRRELALWNLAISIFSFWGFIRVAPHIMHRFYLYESWTDQFCLDPEASYGSGSTGMWCQLWVISKVPEFIDTFFLIVHKKKVIFLHWFHHVVTMAVSLYGYINHTSGGGLYAGMNYGVHAVMYFYYFLMAVKCKPKWFNPIYLTLAQIAQMIVGLYFTVGSAFIYFFMNPAENDCAVINTANLAVAAIPYGAFFYLFTKFFFKRYKVVDTTAEARKRKKNV